MVLGSAQPVTDITTRNLAGVKAAGAWDTLCTGCLKILGASTFWTRRGVSRPVIGELYLFMFLN